MLALLLVAGLASSSPALVPELDKPLIAGIDDIYRMRFDDAEAEARRAIAVDPADPHAYLGLAGVAWTRYVYETDQGDDRWIDEYEKRTAKAVEVGEKWLKLHPKDAQGMMTLGAAYGLSSRLQIIRHHWLKGYWQGRTALQLTTAAVKTDPQLWDAYLGLGMYDYYSDLYPRFIGVLAKIVLRGNRQRGIDYLKLVAEKGHYSRSNAKILLVEIYTEDPYGAKNPERAVELMQDLRREYPDSALMHSAQLVSLFSARRFEDVVKGAREYVELSKKGRYNAIEQGKGNVILGCGLWGLKRYDEALAAFREAQKVPFNGKMSRWAVWASIKAGNLEDMLGRRADALNDYNLALAQTDRWGFYALAKPFVSKPYVAGLPDDIPPP